MIGVGVGICVLLSLPEPKSKNLVKVVDIAVPQDPRSRAGASRGIFALYCARANSCRLRAVGQTAQGVAQVALLFHETFVLAHGSAHIHAHQYIYIYIYICTYTHMHVYTHTHTRAYKHIHNTHVYIYIFPDISI